MKKWFATLLLVAVLAAAGFTVQWWFSPLLAFVGANSNLIQGLADLIQIALWVFALLAFVTGLWFNRKREEKPTTRVDYSSSGDINLADEINIAKSQTGPATGKVDVPSPSSPPPTSTSPAKALTCPPAPSPSPCATVALSSPNPPGLPPPC